MREIKRITFLFALTLLIVFIPTLALAAVNTVTVPGSTIEKQHVSTEQGGTILVNLVKVLNYSEVEITGEAMDRIRSTGKKLIIHCDDFTLELPPGSINSYAGGMTTLRVSRRDTTKLVDYFGSKQLPGPGWKVVSDVFSFSCITEGWDQRELKSLTGNAKVSFSYNKELVTTPANVGLYAFDPQVDKWVYAGGITDTQLNSASTTGALDSYYVLFEGAPQLTDMAKHWARSEVEFLAARGVISGDDQGRYFPDKEISRAEFATMLCKAFGVTSPVPKEASMGTMSRDAWYFPYAYRVSTSSLLIGDPNNWKPNTPVLREDICQGIVRLSKLNEAAEKLGYQEAYDLLTVKDRSSIHYSNYKYVQVLLDQGVISTKAGGWFRPYDTLTKAEAATIIARTLRY